VRRCPGAPALPSASGWANAAAKSAAVTHRSAGVRASALASAASTPGGTVSRTTEIRGSGSLSFLAITICGVSPMYGGSPPSISYSTQPSEYKSERPSRSWLPAACSGLMYAGVPIESPVSVSRALPAAAIALAIPKSATTAWPLSSRMFSGLMSRWTTPWLCA